MLMRQHEKYAIEEACPTSKMKFTLLVQREVK